MYRFPVYAGVYGLQGRSHNVRMGRQHSWAYRSTSYEDDVTGATLICVCVCGRRWLWPQLILRMSAVTEENYASHTWWDSSTFQPCDAANEAVQIMALMQHYSVAAKWNQTLPQGQSWLLSIYWWWSLPPYAPTYNMALPYTRGRDQVQILHIKCCNNTIITISFATKYFSGEE